MRNKAYQTITLLGLFFVLAASAHAQSDDKVEVNVPFDFHAGETELPAGTHDITFIAPRVMKLSSTDGQINILLQVPQRADAQGGVGGAARLVFRRYGQQYFLAEVWTGADYGRGLYMSDSERNLIKELKRGKRSAAQPLKVKVAALAKR